MENQTEVSQVPGSQIEYIKFFLALPNIFGMIFSVYPHLPQQNLILG